MPERNADQGEAGGNPEQPVESQAAGPKRGALLKGLALGLIVAFTIAWGGGKLAVLNYERDLPLQTLWVASFVQLHDLADWLKLPSQDHPFHRALIYGCLIMAPLAGSVIAWLVSRRGWVVTVALFSALYTAIALIGDYLAHAMVFHIDIACTGSLFAVAAVMSGAGALLMRVWAATAFIAIVAAVVCAWLLAKAPKAEPVFEPLTSYPGHTRAPSFSPDGNQVAFNWRGDIYVKLIGSYTPLLLATNGAADPAWSPDGRLIAFYRRVTKGNCDVLLIPALGGTERKLAEIASTEWQGGHYLAWHPGRKWLVVPDRNTPSEPYALFLVSVNTGEKRKLTSPPQGFYGDQDPDVSPDGSAAVFVRTQDLATSDVFLLELSGGLSPKGEPRRLTHDNRYTAGPIWMPDGRAILFTSGATVHRTGLWKLPLSRPGWRPGEAQRLAFAGEDVRGLAVSRQGRLAYVQSSGVGANIWIEITVGGPKSPVGNTVVVK